MIKNIVLIELHQETNSFSNVPTTLREFETLALYYGDEVLSHGIKRYKRFQLSGFIKTIKKRGNGQFTFTPVLAAWATSGGPIEKKVYEHFKEYILEKLTKTEVIDAIYLSMHGAMGVEGIRDPECDLLQEIRKIVGEDLPIGVSYDLHANITENKVSLATFINAYHTNPHRDHFKVGSKAAVLLMDILNGKINPTMHHLKMPLLKGGGMTIDFLRPMNSIFRKMKKMEKLPGVLSVSNFMAHLWLDDQELGWSCLVVTDNDPDLAQKLAEELAEYNWKVRDHRHPEPVSVAEAIRKLKKMTWRRLLGTSVFCDTSDLVAAGAPGENTHIIKELLHHTREFTSYVPLRDGDVVTEMMTKDIGQQVEVTLGQKLEKEYNDQIRITGILAHKAETNFGKTVVVRIQKLFVVLTELPCPAFNPGFFRDLGLSLWKADIVVVKNLFPFRVMYGLYNRKTFNIRTAGTTNLDVFSLKYKNIPRPIYPLDKISHWRN
jgi:microcystin degradation protein MlrC